MIGETLGDFRIEAEIGKGSMALVFRATQMSLSRPVALKVLKRDVFTPSETVKRFFREAVALARLEHPHIVPVYTASASKGYCYLAMRLITGGSLLDAMRSGIDTRTGLEWISHACRALAFAHANGVIHRDVTPANILLDDGTAFLGDFGLARLRDLPRITKRGLALGTPLFMSPEQTRGEEAGPWSDCFSLGVILYFVLTGRHPFVEDAEIENRTLLFERIRAGRHFPASDINAEVSATLDACLRRALAPASGERYASAEAMLADLDQARADMRGVTVVVAATRGRVATPTPTRSREAAGATIQSLALTVSAEPTSSEGNDNPTAGLVPADVSDDDARYEIHEEIGHGGQGIVYRARDRRLDRDVALKVLQTPFRSDPNMLGLFQNEARTAGRLNHPHIIPIFDYGFRSGAPFLAMPLIEGPSLDRLLSRGSPLPIRLCLRVLVQAAGALAYAHRAGVVHLDVKPGNILLRRGVPPAEDHDSEDSQEISVVVTDFTLARWIVASGQRGSGAPREPGPPGSWSGSVRFSGGTLPYASPEQIAGSLESVGPASDFYSLGVILYEMLTGKRLFGSMDSKATKVRILAGEVEPPSRILPRVPSILDRLCLRLLDTDARRRTADTEPIVEAARSLLYDERTET